MYSGGEKAKITWESKKIGNELINIYFSTDNGYNWKVLADRMVDSGLYIWDVPHLDNIYYNCLIKISTNSEKAVQVSSNFTIVNETNKIQIKNPNGGELIEAGSRHNILWESNGLKSDLFKILFSSNNGNTWERLESRVLNSNEFFWKVPLIESENCKIKIIAVENESIYDISEQSFTISKLKKLKISNPINQQKYYSNDQMKINWNIINISGKKVNIYYSRDKGLTWNVIGRAIQNNGNYDWDIPAFDTTSFSSKIKIELSNNVRINDQIDGSFVLYGEPIISLKSPLNKDLVIEDKSNYKIVWDSKNIRENRVNLYYSENLGKKWKPIAIDISNKGYYNWIIPSLNTIDCLFKIESSVQPEINSISDYTIKITEKPLIIIENKLNNKEFTALDSLNLKWKSYNLSDKYLDILLSTDKGKNWKSIVKRIINTNEIKIEIPFIKQTSKNCKIKIVESFEVENFSLSEGLFKINRPEGNLNLLSNNKFKFNYNDTYKIKWDSKHLDDKKGNIYYSLNSGAEWILVESIDLKKSFYNWEVPDLVTTSTKCMIKISIEDANYKFIDNYGIFTINAAPFISIDNNVNDTVKTNMPFSLQTKIMNTNNKKYNLYYSLTKGMQWVKIGGNIDNNNYLWNVPSLKGFKSMLIKAELDLDKNIYETKKFNILEQSINLTLLKPNGSEKYEIGDKVKIIWSVKKIYDKTIDLFYSDDGGNKWEVIKIGASNSGSYEWVINSSIKSSELYKIKVQSNSDTNIFDVSDGLFQIKGSVEAFNIITPNGGDLIYNGTSSFIYWEDIINQKVSNVDISFSSDNGKNWNVIANNLQNNGVYSWVVPSDIKSNKCLIKISSSLDSKQFGKSDNTFIIK